MNSPERIVFFSSVGFNIVLVLVATLLGYLTITLSGGNDESSDDIGYEDCNVAGINLHGDIYTYFTAEQYTEDWKPYYDEVSAEDVIYHIETAENDESIAGILIEIDSYGGSPVGSQEITNAIKRATKPTVALIREVGTSGAYWVATGADTIIASELSEVGSIGVTQSYLDETEQNRQNGLRYIELTTGKFKDTGSPDKSLSNEEKELLLRDLEIMKDKFVNDVAVNRSLTVEEIEKLADGSSMLGKAALEIGLIDDIGDIAHAKNYLQSILNEDIEICWN